MRKSYLEQQIIWKIRVDSSTLDLIMIREGFKKKTEESVTTFHLGLRLV